MENRQEFVKDIKVLASNYISREYAIDDLHGRDPSQIWDTADIEVWINALPSVQPDVPDTNVGELISRQFEEIIVEYPEITDKEHKGKPYYSIKYVEDGEGYIGYGTYMIEVLSGYIRDYFIPPVQPSADLSDYCDKLWKLAYERGKAEGQPRKGKWIDYSDEGYVECPFCHSATNCDDNKDDLHYCFSCGAELR